VIADTDQLVALSLAYQMLNDLTRSIDFTLTNAERGATAAGAASSESSKICQTRILSKGIEQLRDLREDVLRQRAQMRQSYLAALSQANLSANYAGLLRQRDRDAREAAAPPPIATADGKASAHAPYPFAPSQPCTARLLPDC
jgi:conjugative transfer pilus assembly protein TraH